MDTFKKINFLIIILLLQASTISCKGIKLKGKTNNSELENPKKTNISHEQEEEQIELTEKEQIELTEEKEEDLEKQKQLEEEQKAAEAERLEEKRKAAEAERLEEKRKAAEAKRLEEERKAAEAKRLEEERKAAEAKRLEEEQKAAEAKRLEEEGRRQQEIFNNQAKELILEHGKLLKEKNNQDMKLKLHEEITSNLDEENCNNIAKLNDQLIKSVALIRQHKELLYTETSESESNEKQESCLIEIKNITNKEEIKVAIKKIKDILNKRANKIKRSEEKLTKPEELEKLEENIKTIIKWHKDLIKDEKQNILKRKIIVSKLEKSMQEKDITLQKFNKEIEQQFSQIGFKEDYNNTENANKFIKENLKDNEKLEKTIEKLIHYLDKEYLIAVDKFIRKKYVPKDDKKAKLIKTTETEEEDNIIDYFANRIIDIIENENISDKNSKKSIEKIINSQEDQYLLTENDVNFKTDNIKSIYNIKNAKEKIEGIVFDIYKKLKDKEYISKQSDEVKYHDSRLRISIHSILANNFKSTGKDKGDLNNKNQINKQEHIKINESMKNFYVQKICNQKTEQTEGKQEEAHKKACANKIYEIINEHVTEYEKLAKLISNSTSYYPNYNKLIRHQRGKKYSFFYNEKLRKESELRPEVTSKNRIGIAKILRQSRTKTYSVKKKIKKIFSGG